MEILIDEKKLAEEAILKYLEEMLISNFDSELFNIIENKLNDKEYIEKVLKQAIDFVVVKKIDELMTYENKPVLQLIRESLNKYISELNVEIENQIGEITQIKLGGATFVNVNNIKENFENQNKGKVHEVHIEESINLKDNTNLKSED